MAAVASRCPRCQVPNLRRSKGERGRRWTAAPTTGGGSSRLQKGASKGAVAGRAGWRRRRPAGAARGRNLGRRGTSTLSRGATAGEEGEPATVAAALGAAAGRACRRRRLPTSAACGRCRTCGAAEKRVHAAERQHRRGRRPHVERCSRLQEGSRRGAAAGRAGRRRRRPAGTAGCTYPTCGAPEEGVGAAGRQQHRSGRLEVGCGSGQRAGATSGAATGRAGRRRRWPTGTAGGRYPTCGATGESVGVAGPLRPFRRVHVRWGY